ncbi:MAG: indolepyruvate ferredoxin oxidoreductase subunit alpha [Oscillospiraceae bacterium]|nr:indolepyruvate ferredoxin oxidoreductase subunit alpha [Oscillospiraceae bacterium]
MGKKTLMLGNHAIARGCYEAGVTVVSSYPGTPSTEITFAMTQYKGDIHAEWAVNEKVGCEVVVGASIAGARAFTGMKHVGLNVASDPLYTASYAGVNGGLVLAIADDPGMHSSQNEQDSRRHAIASKCLMLEPADSRECLEFTKKAFDLSEEFDVPVLIRLSTRISHSQGIVEEGERIKRDLPDYKKDASKYVMMPVFARGRRVFVDERDRKLVAYAEKSPFNVIEDNNSDIGVICAGTTYQFSREALGDKASYLKLGVVNPLPVELIKEFAKKVKKLYVAEEMDPIIEQHCKAIGLEVIGKDLFPTIGEYSQGIIREKVLGEVKEHSVFPEAIPVRPPVMCAGCSHRGLFTVLGKLGVMVNGDIGCYTLGATPPLSAMDTTICMGAGVSSLHGFNKGRQGDYENRAVGVVGDSTFIHSGITGLINIAYSKSNSTIIIADNTITGMTGGQNTPANGLDIYGDSAPSVDIETMCKACGIKRVTVVDPSDMAETERVLRQELDANEPSVVISRKPCALLKGFVKNKPVAVDPNKCTGCRVCLKVGCPALSYKDKKVSVNKNLCVGCGVCGQLCKPAAFADTVSAIDNGGND